MGMARVPHVRRSVSGAALFGRLRRKRSCARAIGTHPRLGRRLEGEGDLQAAPRSIADPKSSLLFERRPNMPEDSARTPKLAWRSARIDSIIQLTPTVKSFFFRFDEPLRFVAGQHMDVRLTAADGYQAQRSYSIASRPEDAARIELVIEKLDDGEVSPFFHEVAAVGDEIELRGPIGGHFLWRAQDGGPVLLVGGGSGVVPLACMVRH